MNRLAACAFLAVLPLVPPIGAQDLSVTSGVTDFQVLQRNAEERANLQFAGSADHKFNGRYVEARVLQNGRPVPGFDWTPMTKVRSGRWTGEFTGLPTGGPYRLELRLTGNAAVASVEDLLVGDLWVLAGQSNMEGWGNLADVQEPVPQVHSFDMADQWGVAKEPLHTVVAAVDPVHWPKNEKGQPERYTGDKLQQYMAGRKKGAGLGLPFAVEMLRRTGVPVGLIPCAHGGTSMDQWDPALKDKAGASLYGSMMRRITAVGGKVKGILWYQGESDTTPQAAPKFLDKFEKFVQSVRADLGAPDLPFYYVQIGRYVSSGGVADWNLVQTMQLRAESAIPHTGMVPSVDCTLDDPIHISTQGLKRIARRLANLVSHDLFPNVKDYAQTKRGPRPVSAKFENGVVRVTFAEVNGSLQSEGRPAGFSIHGPDGQELPLIFDARFDPGAPNVALLRVAGKIPEKAALWYGFGKDPYCNLRDIEDMGAPVFGPLPIEQ